MKWPIRMWLTRFQDRWVASEEHLNGAEDVQITAWPADQAPEPKAWRYRYSSASEWFLATGPMQLQWTREQSGFEEEPLYAAPPDLAKELAEAQARAEKAEAALAQEEERMDWIIENSVSFGGGNGSEYTVKFFVPVDLEDLRGAITDAIRNSRGERG